MTDTPRFIGRVKFYNTRYGYGFIHGPLDVDDQSDIYFRHNGVSPSSTNFPITLYQGEYVEYELIQVQNDDPAKSTIASNITGLYGGPLMMDSRPPKRRRPDYETNRKATHESRQSDNSSSADRENGRTDDRY